MSNDIKEPVINLDTIFGTSSPLDFENMNLQDAIQTIEEQSSSIQTTDIPIKRLIPNPYQPRKHFDEEKLNELAGSIKEHGVFQPIIVKKKDDNYQIVAGERRYRASLIANLEKIPAIIVDFTEQQMMEIALLENIQRENLNAIEEAQAYHEMMDKLKLTQEQLSHRVGKSRAHVANTVRLLKMPQQLQDYVLKGALTMGHIKPLITIDETQALNIARRAINEKLSVREVENLVKGIKLQGQKSNREKEISKYSYLETAFRKQYNIKAKIKSRDNKNTLTLSCSDEDLENILKILQIQKI
ncbi:ParB/RepB/Spo0J family partition protein [Massilimicrobiota timonensis]|uniref:ParB/RepB/Spo0J family partition protein n=1 Tax=Massilimicrobiota timonensis TaxID=1776392 RepID=UPI00101D5B1F|nr:ParB/RepB/Spo0J family partition protein [Massilimicrobiota timonensis]